MMRQVVRILLSLGGVRQRRFVVAGGIGFLVDAAILTLLTDYAGWSLIRARMLSFLGAVSITWLINRYYAFAERRAIHAAAAASEYSRYLLTQGVGALFNLAIFALLLWWAPALRMYPVLPLALASGCALFLNYYLMQWWVFPRRTASV